MNSQNSTTVILNTPKTLEAAGERADANWNWFNDTCLRTLCEPQLRKLAHHRKWMFILSPNETRNLTFSGTMSLGI